VSALIHPPEREKIYGLASLNLWRTESRRRAEKVLYCLP
jgi:hypothetical protein